MKRLPHAMVAVGFVLVVTSYAPLGLSDWLPRWATWLGGVWTVVVGIGVTLMLTEEEE